MKRLILGSIMIVVCNATFADRDHHTFLCSNVTDGFELDVGVKSKRQCNQYVRYETGLEYDACNGNAENCYAQAEDYGYSVGSTPVLNSVLVMGHWSSNSAGHAAIVIDIDSENSSRVKVRDSNWSNNNDEIVREHWIDTDASKYGTIGYVYCDSDSEQNSLSQPWASSNNLAWQPTDATCQDVTIWRNVETGNIIANRDNQSVDGYALCISYNVSGQCKP